MRGHLDALEGVLNDCITEMSYHVRQNQITCAEKDTSGAILCMNVVKAHNTVLNEEHKTRQESKKNRDAQQKTYDMLNRHVDACIQDHNSQNARLLALQRRIWE